MKKKDYKNDLPGSDLDLRYLELNYLMDHVESEDAELDYYSSGGNE